MDLVQRLLVHAWVRHLEVGVVIDESGVPRRVCKLLLVLHKLVEHEFVI